MLAIYTRDPDSDLTLAVRTDRSQGGSSLVDGQVELMVHRQAALFIHVPYPN